MRYFKEIRHFYTQDRVEIQYHKVNDKDVDSFLFNALDCDVYDKEVSQFEINPYYWRSEHRFVEVIELPTETALENEQESDDYHYNSFLKS